MHHRWLLLFACVWVLFMLMVASKFIALTMKIPEGKLFATKEYIEGLLLENCGHINKPGTSRKLERSRTILPELEKSTVTEAKALQIEIQTRDLGRTTYLFNNVSPTATDPQRLSNMLRLREQILDLIRSYHLPDGDLGEISAACLSEVAMPTADPVRSMSDINLIHKERIELLENLCRDEALGNMSHTTISKFILDRIFVSDKHKILFCQTPKVGNTQWKKVLIVLNGAFSSLKDIPEYIVHDHEKNGLPRLSSYGKSDVHERLKSYFKFLIVRDPFERLISAYKDKFVKNPRSEPWYLHNIAPAIIRKYRKNRTHNKGGLQFEDFVRYLGDPNHKFLDLKFGEHIIHWLPYVELCAPCEINYNVIGHHETLEDDAPYILKKAGVEKLVSYPYIPPGITHYNQSKVEHYFSTVSKRDLKRLYERFKVDFKLFGYREPTFLF